jgi:hypothetical protein
VIWHTTYIIFNPEPLRIYYCEQVLVINYVWHLQIFMFAHKIYTQALLSGCSAGGLAAILNCDKFRSLLSTSTRVKCVSDAGYFPHL